MMKAAGGEPPPSAPDDTVAHTTTMGRMRRHEKMGVGSSVCYWADVGPAFEIGWVILDWCSGVGAMTIALGILAIVILFIVLTVVDGSHSTL
jgi:hypothetical protein